LRVTKDGRRAVLTIRVLRSCSFGLSDTNEDRSALDVSRAAVIRRDGTFELDWTVREEGVDGDYLDRHYALSGRLSSHRKRASGTWESTWKSFNGEADSYESICATGPVHWSARLLRDG
jgi:hypothetical protein